MENAKVSVFIPLCDNVKQCENCIMNVQNQTLINIEIICLNNINLSKDILDIYVKKFPNILITKDIYKSVKSAKGKYIFFLNNNIVLKEIALEKLYIECLINELDFVCFDESRQLIDINYTITGSNLFEYLIKNSIWQECSTGYFVLKHNYLNSYVVFSDFYDPLPNFKLMLKSKKVKCLNDKLYTKIPNNNKILENNDFYYNLKLYITLFNLSSCINLDEKISNIIIEFLNDKINSIQTSYAKMSSKEKEVLKNLTQIEIHFFNLIMKSSITKEEILQMQKIINNYETDAEFYKNKYDAIKNDVNKYKGQMKYHKNEKENIKISLSYRIGRIITFIPRKIRDKLI